MNKYVSPIIEIEIVEVEEIIASDELPDIDLGEDTGGGDDDVVVNPGGSMFPIVPKTMTPYFNK